ncbi:hypothetical protein HanPSC8_Chr06g0239451 [Helianthus annuus]|nr:hypothetical protein HanPSC8_Chr06g0239451 [Helianthus annuus]
MGGTILVLTLVFMVNLRVLNMELENITMLNNLNPLTNNYTLKLKIICLWWKMMHGRPTETFCVDMICMDEEGQKIRTLFSLTLNCMLRYQELRPEKASKF